MDVETLPEQLNIADWLLDARVSEGRGDRPALLTDQGSLTYGEVQALANRFGHVLGSAAVEPEQRVIIALPDGPEFVAALFGTLKVGAVAVMVNPQLTVDTIEYLYAYTRAAVAVVHRHSAPLFQAARGAAASGLKHVLVMGEASTARALDGASPDLETFPTHRDDPAIWLLAGGSGNPKAVVQTHRSFAYATRCYGQGVLGLTERDRTLSVPKLFSGYATGSNLFFPFSVGAAAALFPEKSTVETVFAKIRKFRPTILINEPTMVEQMAAHPEARAQDLSALRLATSTGEALPIELYERWMQTFGVELLDGLGTAEMWHIFISNTPGAVRPGTLGTVVPGFDVRVRDDLGHDLPDGEVGMLWVRGDSRAIGYWRQMEKTKAAFRGEWYVSGDLIRRDADGYFTYCGRADDRGKLRLQ
jgi:acyl-coenzyme A synthetase/AMP-(fatty) acid ligase